MTDDNPLEQRIESDDYGPDSPCSQCGEILDQYCPEWTEYCLRHSDRRTSPMVLELEGLVEDLTAEPHNIINRYHAGKDMAGRELQSIIEKYD